MSLWPFQPLTIDAIELDGVDLAADIGSNLDVARGWGLQYRVLTRYEQ